MRNQTVTNLLIIMCFLCISCLTDAVADLYQWTDPDGTVHFSDTPSNVPRGSTPVKRQEEPDSTPATGNTVYGNKVGVKAGRQMRRSKNISSDENMGENAVQNSRNIDPQKEPEKNPVLEAGINEVWRMHNNALARNDAVSAAGYIAPDEREGCLETFIAFGKDLKNLNHGNEEFEIVYIKDGIAKALLFRKEVVRGTKERVGYPVYFHKVNGTWKLDKC